LLLIGTAGYSYRDWVGPFYPEGIKTNEMLEYYSRHFSFTEVNSSYYHMPASRTFEALNKKTPEGFRFSVKLFGGFTHERNLGEKDAAAFLYTLEPLQESGKLVCLLAQFPYSFHFTPQNADYLKRLREWFKDVEICVEFRNNGWISQETIRLMKDENMGFVCVDEPRIRGLINNVIVSTSKISYIRMHGRNSEKWYGGSGSERYNYSYSREELIEWIGRIKELEGRSATTIVSFNNHPLGKAVENAKLLMKMVGC